MLPGQAWDWVSIFNNLFNFVPKIHISKKKLFWDKGCLHLQPIAMNWMEAQIYCHQFNAYLVEIFDPQQQNLLAMFTESETTEIGKCSPWIGLTNIAQNPDDWVWVHSLNNTNTNTSYTSWAYAHPYNDLNFNFVLMGWGDDYNWVDVEPTYATCSICQYFPQ